MSGAVIENLSTRKLCFMLASLLAAAIVFFLVGGLISPEPSSSMSFLMTKCEDRAMKNDWLYLRPKMNCKPLHFETYVPQPGGNLRDVVFVAQMPHVRGGITLEYSPWFQFLLGLLDIDIEYDPDRHLAENALLQLEVRLGYRTHDDPPTTWHELISTTVTRRLDCSIAEDKKEMNAAYNCSVLDLFELGSNAYPFYLINIRLPVNEEQCMKDPSGPNCAIGRLKDLSIIEIHQNGGFTKIWLAMKTLLTPFVLAATIWYWSRIRQLTRQPYLLEKAIFALGVSLASLDFPLEWLSLWFRLPFMLLVCDLRQGLFYAMLFSFWLIFTGEHLIEDSSRNSLIAYWRHLAFVVVASLCLLVYDMCERGIQLSNPFYSIWSTSVGTNLAYAIIYVASLCALLYFVFLVYKVGRVWSTIKRKRAAALQMNRNRRLKFEMIIYRFKFLMALTVVCAGFTIASYIMKQYGESQMHSDEFLESPLVNSTSAFFTGTFGLWNIYVILLLAMYAPSHKQYAGAVRVDDDDDDLGEPTATEQSVLATFVKPAVD